MTKSKRFEPIRQIASNSADALRRGWAAAAPRVADLERQLEQLESYRAEYMQSAATAGSSMDAVRLQNYRSFLDRLGDAKRQHQKNLDAARAEFEKRRALWSEKRVEAESLGRVVDRFRKEERAAEDRKEQHEGDDAAMRISLSRSQWR
jgi:flagellar FliJ protein